MGDFDGDCGVDLTDYGQAAFCLTGPGNGLAGPVCEPADFDGDADTDLRDFAGFQILFDGL
jgi:hypothetical protein